VSYLFENLEGVKPCDRWILLDKHDIFNKSPIFTCVMFFPVNLVPMFSVIVLPVPVIFLVIGHFLLVIGGGGGGGDYNNLVKFSNFFFHSCTAHFDVIKSFICPTNTQFSYFKMLKFTLRFIINTPTCFGLTKPSSGSLQPLLR